MSSEHNTTVNSDKTTDRIKTMPMMSIERILLINWWVRWTQYCCRDVRIFPDFKKFAGPTWRSEIWSTNCKNMANNKISATRSPKALDSSFYPSVDFNVIALSHKSQGSRSCAKIQRAFAGKFGLGQKFEALTYTISPDIKICRDLRTFLKYLSKKVFFLG